MKGVILVLYIICTISFVRAQTDGVTACEFAVLSLLDPSTIEGIQSNNLFMDSVHVSVADD